MIAYIIVSELFYTLWHSDIDSGIGVFLVMLTLVIGLMVQDVRREKRQEKHLPMKRGVR